MSPALAAMLIGVAGTTFIHLSKAMMREGVQWISDLRRGTRPESLRSRTWAFYVAAVVLNHTNPLWIIWANHYAAPSYYTSMYGLGLIALLLYSVARIGETVPRPQILASIGIMAGTLLLGLSGLQRPVLDYATIRLGLALSLIAGAIAIATVAVLHAVLAGRSTITGATGTTGTMRASGAKAWGPNVGLEIRFGVLAGMLSAFDPVLKGVAQSSGGPEQLLPAGLGAWLIFVLSFVLALAAFTVTNWGFFRGCRASVMIAAYGASYVTAPVLVQLLSLPEFSLSGAGWLGLALVNLAIPWMMRSARTTV